MPATTPYDIAEVTAGALVAVNVAPGTEARDPDRVELESAAPDPDLGHGLELLRDNVLQQVLDNQLVVDFLAVLDT